MSLRTSFLVVMMIAANCICVSAQDCTPITDCNNNSQQDSCDISQGLSSDCDLDGVPDECQMAESVLADCNMNGLLDACEPVLRAETTGAATGVGTMDGPHLLMTDLGTRSIELYERLGTAWIQKDAIVPSDADANDGFGFSMALSGSLLVVGAPNKSGDRGAAYVYEKQGNSWVQIQVLQAANPLEGDVFGSAVSVMGSTIAVGAPQSAVEEPDNPVDANIPDDPGFVEVWTHNGTEFERTASLDNFDPFNGGGEEFGKSLALTDNGWLMVGSPNDGPPGGAGRVFGYQFNGTEWVLAQEISTTDSPQGAAFGTTLSWSAGTLAVSAERTLAPVVDDPRIGAVYTFENSEDGNSWSQTDRLISTQPASQEYGFSHQVSGQMLIVGEPGVDSSAGMVHLYNRMEDGTWSLVDMIRPITIVNGDNLGSSVATNGEWISYSADGLSTNIEHREIVPDCNANGADDRCEIRSGLIPDCNGNIIPDSCDIANGTELDCDLDGVPDACFLANGGPDCNANGVPDSCDIASLQSSDCNANGIPDECEADCDENGTPDDCDLASGAPDCNANGTLDSCDIASGTSVDCDLNTVPDSCDLANGASDCDTDLVPDHCQIAADPALDCDVNGAIDSCELLANAGLDCNSNNRIDSCDIAEGTSADCDLNGNPDECQIASGFSIDCNSNAIPDECEDPFLESTPPTFVTSVANIALDSELGVCGATASWTDPELTDNCDDLLDLSSSHPNGGQFPVGTTEVTLTATDDHGNNSTSTFTVTVTDVEDPMITAMPATIEINNDLNQCGAAVTWSEPTITDNCLVSSSGPDVANGSVFEVGSHVVTYTATDSAGRTSSASFDIIVTDAQAPAFTSTPENMILDTDLDQCGAVANWTPAVPGDNCAILSTISTHNPGDFFPTGTSTVTTTTTDTAGLTAVHSFTITVNDVQPPTLSEMPLNMVVNAEAGLCEAAVDWTAPLTQDNCSGETLQGSHAPGSSFAVGNHTVTYTVTDSSGLTSEASFEIVVEDHQNPTFDLAPSTMTLQADSGLCQTAASWDTVEYSDNCAVLQLISTHQSGDTFEVGTTTVSMTLEDIHGNSAAHSFDVIVEDNQLPSISGMPANITQNNDAELCGAVVTWMDPTSEDNCAIEELSSSHPNGGVFDVGTTTVTYTALDIHGNSSTASFDIVIADNEAPTISSLSGDLSSANDLGSCGAFMFWSEPRGDDNCNLLSLTSTHQSGSFFDVGTTTVTYTATDIYGNEFAQSFDITITDSENPSLAGDLGDMTVSTDLDQCDAVVMWSEPEAVDNCPGATYSSDIANGSALALGSTLVTYTVVDAAGNSFETSFTVIVEDNQLPSISGMPANITQNNDAELCGAVVTWMDPTSEDNCAIEELSSSHPNGGVFDVGTTTVTYTALDIHGNSSTASFDIVIADNEAPTISSLSGDLSSANDLGSCGAFMFWSEPRGDDNCNLLSLTSTHQSGSFFDVGTTTVTYTATDIYGNEFAQSFDITITDSENPSLAGDLGDMTVSTDLDQCDAVVMWSEPEAVDNCPGATYSSDIANGSALALGSTLVTYTVVDAAGNSFETSFTVTVEDNQSPVFDSAPQDITLNSDSGQCSAAHSWAAPQTSDNCPNLNLNTSHPSGSAFSVGTTDVTMFLTDGSNNTVQHTFTITVVDIEDPLLSGVPTDMNLTTDPGVCGANVDWALPVATDNCDVSDLVSSYDPGDFFEIGTTTVSYSVADGSGNLVTSSFNITISDEEAPIIGTTGDLTIAAPAGTCSAVVDLPAATGSDNCQLVALTNSLNGGSDASGIFEYGSTLITWTATDSAGNVATVDQTVTVTVDMTDCNANGAPDVCEIVEGSVLDCDGNGIPDECDTDCDGNGIPDACDLASGSAEDCNGNDIPDSCDLAGGTSIDTNGNATPDECEPSFRRGDANEDGSVDIADAIFMLYTLMLNGPQSGCADATDSNDSGSHDIADAVFILTYQFAGGEAPSAPGPDTCGVDATPNDGLGCDSYNGCP